MKNYRSVAKNTVILTLALALGACLSDSDGVESTVALEITAPTGSTNMDTTDASVGLAGTASSDVGIQEVTWASDKGAEGIANGTESWEISSVELELGENEITITAEDVAGGLTSKSLVVNRESGENGSVTLAWIPPTARVDGSPLTNLAGYKIYYGRMSGIYDYEIELDGAGITTYVIENLVSGDWFFSLAAYDSEGLESDRSNEVLREIS